MMNVTPLEFEPVESITHSSYVISVKTYGGDFDVLELHDEMIAKHQFTVSHS